MASLEVRCKFVGFVATMFFGYLVTACCFLGLEAWPDTIGQQLIGSLVALHNFEAWPALFGQRSLSESCCELVDKRRQSQLVDGLGSTCLSEETFSEVRQRALWGLGTIGSPASFCAEAVAARLSDMDDRMVRLLACRTLQTFERSNVEPFVSALRETLNDSDFSVQVQAHSTLQDLGFMDFPPCVVENSNGAPGLACACRVGYHGIVSWNGDSAHGQCVWGSAPSSAPFQRFFDEYYNLDDATHTVMFICGVVSFILSIIAFSWFLAKALDVARPGFEAVRDRCLRKAQPNCATLLIEKLTGAEKKVRSATRLRARASARSAQPEANESTVSNSLLQKKERRESLIEDNVPKTASAGSTECVHSAVQTSLDSGAITALEANCAQRLQRAIAAEARAETQETAEPTVCMGLSWMANLETRHLSGDDLARLGVALAGLQERFALEKARRELNAEESTNCVVCLAAPRGVVLLDCGHIVVCAKCAKSLDVCPICRQRVREHRRIFNG